MPANDIAALLNDPEFKAFLNAVLGREVALQDYQQQRPAIAQALLGRLGEAAGRRLLAKMLIAERRHDNCRELSALAREMERQQPDGVAAGLIRSVLAAYGRDSEVCCYRLYRENAERLIPPLPEEAQPRELPDDFFIPRGLYLHQGKAFALQKEGLYRFFDGTEDLAQRIVYERDLLGLLSSLSWLLTHGYQHCRLAFRDWMSAAKTGKLSLTCGMACRLVQHALALVDVPSRGVTLKPDQFFPKAESGHTMLEVWSQSLGQWILSDPDRGFLFQKDEKLLNAYQFHKLNRQGGQYRAVPLRGPMRRDTGDYSKTSLALLECRLADPPAWYRESCHYLFILDQESHRFVYFDDLGRVENTGQQQAPLHLREEEFLARLYGRPPR